jgi:hypothetical protein
VAIVMNEFGFTCGRHGMKRHASSKHFPGFDDVVVDESICGGAGASHSTATCCRGT